MNKDNLFFIIAAGPSFIDITNEEWEFLKDKHTISFTRVPYGSKKTEYWFSIEREYIDESVLKYMAKLGWFDVRLLLYLPNSIKLAKSLGFKNIRKINKGTFYFMPSRRPWFVDEKNPPHSMEECMANTFHEQIYRFRGQLIAVINACLILGATEIRLIGVDLNEQKNFYDMEYLKECCKDKDTIKDYQEHHRLSHIQSINEIKINHKDFDEKYSHTTNIPLKEPTRWGERELRGVSDIIQWIDKEMKSNGMEGIYVTNKSSLLYKENKIGYKSIMDTR